MRRPLWLLVVMALLVGGTAMADTPWHHPLYLGGDGFWKQRFVVTFHNGQETPQEGTPFALAIGNQTGQVNLVGQPAEQLRVVDSHGIELLFAVRPPQGEPLRRGPIPADSQLIVPVECPAKASTTVYVYFDNPSAGEVADLFQPKTDPVPADPKALSVLGIKPEKITLAEWGKSAPWLRKTATIRTAPDRRMAARVYNFTTTPLVNQPTTLSVREFAVRTGQRLRECLVLVNPEGKQVPFVASADSILFAADVPAESVQTYWVYVWDQPPRGEANAAEVTEMLLDKPNLLKNASLEAGEATPEGWTLEPETLPPGVTVALDDPGRTALGRRCVRIDVPEDKTLPEGPTKQWYGWSQKLPVTPGKSYLLRGWVKTKNVLEGVSLESQLWTADGKKCHFREMLSQGAPINGDQDWTLLSGTFTVPWNATTLQVHLASHLSGTVWFDDLKLIETALACPGQPEGRQLSSFHGLRAWQVPAVVKVFPDDPAPERPAAAAISVAHNEKEPLQLALRAGLDLKGAEVQIDPPVGPRNAKLTSWSVDMQGYVPIDYPGGYYHATETAWQRKFPTVRPGCDGWQGLCPDPLLPGKTFDLSANQTGAVWLTVTVDKDQPAGDYRGRVRFVHQGRTLTETPFTVHVWNFAIPEESHLLAIYDVHQGGAKFDPSQKPEEVGEKVRQRMAANRLCPNMIPVVPNLRYENHRVIADFTEYDRAAEHYFDELKLPHSYMPQMFYAFGWGFPPADFSGERPYPGEPPYKDVDRSQLRREYREAYQGCLRTFWEHLKARGWDKKFTLYIADEPLDDQPAIHAQMLALCQMIHEVDPQIPIYSSTWHHVPGWEGALNVWGVGNLGTTSVGRMAQLQAGGAKLWFTTDGMMCTDTPYCGIERLLPYYCFKYGVNAYEFWGVDWLSYNPLQFGWHEYIFLCDQPGAVDWIRYPNGDGFLLYPGKAPGTGPISTVRFEQAREGIEDYEYLELLRQRIEQAKSSGRDVTAAEQTLERARQLVTIPNAGGRNSSRILPQPEVVYQVRQAVAEAIEHLKN